MFRIQVADASIIDNPDKAKENTIYLIPNELAPGTHREYVKYSKIENGRVVHKMEQLGSASGICSKLSKPDKYLKDTVFVNGVLKQRVGFSPEVDPSGSLDTVIETPLNLNAEDLERLKDKVSALENKEDKDTIFDPTEINKKIKDLESRPVSDLEPLNRRITDLETKCGDCKGEMKTLADKVKVLEAKPDKDTVFDPSSLMNIIEGLKSEIETLKSKTDADDYVISGEWDNDDTITLTLNGGRKITIRKPEKPKPIVPPTPPPPPAPKPKPKIKWGYIDLNGRENRVPTIQDITNEKEVTGLPIEFKIPTNGAVRGKYIFAIDKSLLPNNYKVRMKALGQFLDVTEDEMLESEEVIDGVTYVVFKDTSINRDWGGPEFKISIQ